MAPVPRPATSALRPPSRLGAVFFLLAFCALAAASSVRVTDNDTIDTVHGERFLLASRFEVVESALAPTTPLSGPPLGVPDVPGVPPSQPSTACGLPGAPNAGNPAPPPVCNPVPPCAVPHGLPNVTLAPGAPMVLPAIGTRDCPVEISEAFPPARTAVTVGNETYTVTVRERAPASVLSGVWAVSLTLDERAIGTVYLIQNVSDPNAKEGARITFDLGDASLDAPLFVVYVSPVATGGCDAIKSTTDSSLNFRWQGVGGDIEGMQNPTLAAKSGAAMCIKVSNGDGTACHNLRVKDASGTVVAGPTDDVCSLGDAQTLTWTPSAPGSYRYECRYHGFTQHGTINVNG